VVGSLNHDARLQNTPLTMLPMQISFTEVTFEQKQADKCLDALDPDVGLHICPGLLLLIRDTKPLCQYFI
jgi:hypothetical protein